MLEDDFFDAQGDFQLGERAYAFLMAPCEKMVVVAGVVDAEMVV